MNIVVLGSGGWGTALAMLLEQNRHTVTLWSHDSKKAEQLKLKRENPLLPRSEEHTSELQSRE